jgi:predicted ATPase
MHSGEAEERDGSYFGAEVNRAARLMAVAHGGQVLCSSTTAELVEGSATLLDLGDHRLRDLDRPLHVFQVGEGRFPPLRSLSAFPGNLPVRVTGFVGRDHEVRECAQALETFRVVTITGAGGVGKTRLGLQVAAEVLTRFADGAWLVELAGVADSATVEEATATALMVQPRADQALRTTLVDFLRTKRLLLVLDNCEHVVAAVANLLEGVVAGCPNVVVLVTSRESLAVSGEHLLPLSPMQLPDGDTLDVVASCEAVRLFVERAAEVRSGFAVTPANAAVLAELCRRLDGIPLAIELAAARVRSMSLPDILSHLDRRFRLLTGGRRTALSRQQTLRGAIDWSYDLLDDPERMLLRRLAVFVGGFDLAAVERVGEGGLVDALDIAVLLDHLVDKSVVVAQPSGRSSRFRLLEMIRDYSWDRLRASGETQDVCRRHAEYFEAFATSADRGLRGPDYVSWTEQIERDLDNLRAALKWAIDAGEFDIAVRIVASLATGSASTLGLLEGQLPAIHGVASPQARSRLLRALAGTALVLDSGLDVRAIASEALSLVPADPPSALRAELLGILARAHLDFNHQDAFPLATEALDLARSLNLPEVMAEAATTLTRVRQGAEDLKVSAVRLAWAAAQARTVEAHDAELRAMYNLGSVTFDAGRMAEALVAYQQTLTRAEELRLPWTPYGIMARTMVATIYYIRGDWNQVERVTSTAGESAPESAEMLLRAVWLGVLAARGDDTGLETLASLRAWSDKDGLIAILTGAAAIDMYGDRGDIAGAIKAHDKAVAAVTRLWRVPTFAARVRLSALLIGQLANDAARTPDESKKDLIEEISTLAGAADEAAQFSLSMQRYIGPETQAWAQRASAEHLRLRWQSGINIPSPGEMVDAWRAVADRFGQLGHRFETARSQARLAAALHLAGHEKDARSMRAEVEGAALLMGAQPQLWELRRPPAATISPTGRRRPSSNGP